MLTWRVDLGIIGDTLYHTGGIMDKGWTYRNFAAHIEGPRDSIAKYDELIAAVQAQFNFKRYQAMAAIFLWGMDVAMDKVTDEAAARDARTARTKMKLLRLVRETKIEDKQIAAAAREIGEERLVQMAVMEGLDEDEVRGVLQQASGASSFTDKAMAWLSDFMADGEERSTNTIRREAFAQGCLKTDSDWENLRAMASRAGYSKRYGIWQKPTNH